MDGVIKKLTESQIVPDDLKNRLVNLNTENGDEVSDLWNEFMLYAIEVNKKLILEKSIEDPKVVAGNDCEDGISRENNQKEASEKRTEMLFAIGNIVKLAKYHFKMYQHNGSLMDFAISINNWLNDDRVDLSLRREIGSLCATFWLENYAALNGKFYGDLLRFFFDQLITEKKTTKKRKLDGAAAKLINEEKLRKLVNRLSDYAESYDEVEKVCEQMIVNLCKSNFLDTKHGPEIMAAVIALKDTFIMEFHECVKTYLVEGVATDTVHIARVLHLIWKSANPENRKILEEKCLQYYMERSFHLPRYLPSVKKLRRNLTSLLSNIHAIRHSPNFSKTLTTLYKPLIWRSLSDPDAIIRINAVEILMDIYPMESDRSGQEAYHQFIYDQNDAMLKALKDNCVEVRIMAVKGICNNLRHYWSTFGNGILSQIFSQLSQLAIDDSSHELRKCCYEGLTLLVAVPQSHQAMKILLNLLKPYFEDEHQKVRISIYKMLAAIKEKELKDKELRDKESNDNETSQMRRGNDKKFGTLKLGDVVDANFMARQMMVESKNKNRILLLKLFSHIFFDTRDMESAMLNIVKFIKLYPSAFLTAMILSKSVLSYDDTLKYLFTILFSFRSMLKRSDVFNKNVTNENESSENEKSNSENENSNTDNDDRRKDFRRKEGRKPLKQIGNTINADSKVNGTAEEISEEKAIPNIWDSDEVAQGLLDAVLVLWYMRKDKLHEDPDNLNLLRNLVIKVTPRALVFYKGRKPYYSILQLASYVPLQSIQYKCTVFSFCLSFLRNMDANTPRGQVESVLIALCLWNKVGEALDLATELIDDTLRYEGLNDSLHPTKRRRTRKVRFEEASEPKCLIGLKIVEILLESPKQRKILFTHKPAILEYYNYLARIKDLALKRLRNCSQLSPQVPDEFISKCFVMYVNLALHMHRNGFEELVDCVNLIFDNMEWCATYLLADYNERNPFDGAEATLKVTVLNEVFQIIATLFDLKNFQVTEERMNKIVAFLTAAWKSGIVLRLFDHGLLTLCKRMLEYCLVFEKPKDGVLPFAKAHLFFIEALVQLYSVLEEHCHLKDDILKYFRCATLPRLLYEYAYDLWVIRNENRLMMKPINGVYSRICDFAVYFVAKNIEETQELVTYEKQQDCPTILNLFALHFFLRKDNLAYTLFDALFRNLTTEYKKEVTQVMAVLVLLYYFARNVEKYNPACRCRAKTISEYARACMDDFTEEILHQPVIRRSYAKRDSGVSSQDDGTTIDAVGSQLYAEIATMLSSK